MKRETAKVCFGCLGTPGECRRCAGHDAGPHIQNLFESMGGNYPEDQAAFPKEGEPIEFLIPDTDNRSDPMAHAIAAEEGRWPDGTPFEDYFHDGAMPNGNMIHLIRQPKPRPVPVTKNAANGSSAGSASRIRISRGNYIGGKKGHHRDKLTKI